MGIERHVAVGVLPNEHTFATLFLNPAAWVNVQKRAGNGKSTHSSVQGNVLRYFLSLLAMLLAACGGGPGGGVPVFEQSNVHFSGCPTVAVSAPANCYAKATLRNQGATGMSRQVFYYSLRSNGGSQTATCTPDVPNVPAGGTVDLNCSITVPAGAVPTDLVLSGH